MKYLIVSADDFGMAKGINEGIARACKEGIVTNINVIPAGDAFYDCLTWLKSIAPAEIGAHLALTEISPLSSPGRIPTLVDKDGRFHKNHNIFFLKLFLGKISEEEIALELKSQMDRLKSVGIPVTSLSSHEHIHLYPDILKIFIKIAKEYDVPAIRYVRGDVMVSPIGFKKLYRKMVLSFFQMGIGRILKGSGLKYTDNFTGLLDSGNLDEETLISMLKAIPDGTTELVAHPGLLSPEVLDRCVFHKRCETDLAALISKRVRKFIEDNGIVLINFSSLSAGK